MLFYNDFLNIILASSNMRLTSKANSVLILSTFSESDSFQRYLRSFVDMTIFRN